MAKREFLSIQLLRGLAAALVVVAHVLEHPLPGEHPNSFLLTGRLGVEIFFVISGFIIFYITGDRPFNPAHFAVRRVLRVVPLYWVCTTLVMGSLLASPQLYKTTVFDLGYYFSSLFFIPDPLPTNPDDWRPIFKLGWTLNYEMFFYLVVVALFWCKTALARISWLTAILGTLILAACIFPRTSSVFAFYANLNIVPFLAGVWIAWSVERVQFERFRSIILVGAVLATIGFYGVRFAETRAIGGHVAMSATAALIVLAGLANERHMRSIYTPLLNGLKAVGDSSYSLYLTHMFIVGAGWAVLRALHTGPFLTTLGALVMVIAAFIAAYFSFLYLERPFNAFAHEWTARPSTARALT